jgi:hypothetical protein
LLDAVRHFQAEEVDPKGINIVKIRKSSPKGKHLSKVDHFDLNDKAMYSDATYVTETEASNHTLKHSIQCALDDIANFLKIPTGVSGNYNTCET